MTIQNASKKNNKQDKFFRPTYYIEVFYEIHMK